jgi:hypothetical protein
LTWLCKKLFQNSISPVVIGPKRTVASTTLIKEKFEYHEESESFVGITSKFIPIQRDFIKFWETTISLVTIEQADQFENEIEIDELCSLFKIWAKQTNEQLMTNGNISEENVLKILKHFFTTIEIIEQKYILNISCSLWDKTKHIDNSFCYTKDEFKKDYKLQLISFDEVYNYYYKYCKLNSCKLIVSKRYFEKYLYYKVSDYIVYDKFIETNWILNS